MFSPAVDVRLAALNAAVEVNGQFVAIVSYTVNEVVEVVTPIPAMTVKPVTVVTPAVKTPVGNHKPPVTVRPPAGMVIPLLKVATSDTDNVPVTDKALFRDQCTSL